VDRTDYEVVFGPSNIVMQSADVAEPAVMQREHERSRLTGTAAETVARTILVAPLSTKVD
jgi:hypothetical protein